MNKIKVASLLMALVMLMSAVAFAAEIPSSKTIKDVLGADWTSEAPGGWSDAKGTTAGEGTDSAKAAVTKELAKAPAGSLASFGSAQAGILALGNVSGIAEMFAVNFGGTYSSGLYRWSVAAALTVGKPVVVALGVQVGEYVQWYPVAASVKKNQDGYTGTQVQFYLTKELFDLKPTILAVLV